jgi:ribosomal protein S18 acetylase RimI-like enzyme
MRRRHALAADLPEMSAVLARSFFNDPQMSFLFPDPDTREADLQVMFATIAVAGLRRGHTYVLTDDGGSVTSAAIWSPPEIESLSDDEVGPLVEVIAGRYGDEGLGRVGAMSEAMAEHHPADPHLYLFIVGVDPSLQGQKLGEAMVTPTLAHCDATGTAAYLESSNPRNIGFYERLGFHTVSEFHPEGGPLFIGMWRNPVA